MKLRAAKRKEDREREAIAKEFDSLVQSFLEVLFSYNFDQELEDFPLFETYSDIWKSYCQHASAICQFKIVQPDPLAFYKFAIDQNPGDAILLQDGKRTGEVEDLTKIDKENLGPEENFDKDRSGRQEDSR